MHLYFIAVFWKCAKKKKEKKEKKAKKMSDFLKAYISEMAGTIYFRSGRCSVPICRACTANLVLFGQETTELRTRLKSYFVFRTHVVCAHPVFWGCTTHYRVSWYLPCERILWIWKYEQNGKFQFWLNIHILLTFYLILTGDLHIIIVKRYLKDDFKLKDAFWGGF